MAGGQGVRPTTALVRRGLFDTLASSVIGAVVLDLYAGVGTLGLEALSRGARHVTFVERNPRCAKIVQENLRRLGLTERSKVDRAEVGAWLKKHEQDLLDFGLILLDPPYRDRGLDELMPWLSQRVRWSPQNLIVTEHHRRRSIPPLAPSLRLEQQRDYGDTRLSFWRGVA